MEVFSSFQIYQRFSAYHLAIDCPNNKEYSRKSATTLNRTTRCSDHFTFPNPTRRTATESHARNSGSGCRQYSLRPPNFVASFEACPEESCDYLHWYFTYKCSFDSHPCRRAGSEPCIGFQNREALIHPSKFHISSGQAFNHGLRR